MHEYPKYNVKVIRDVTSRSTSWPDDQDDSELGCNREYTDLSHLSWSEAVRVHRLEGELIARIEQAADPGTEYEKIAEAQCEEIPEMYGLDLGVASSVVALSAARCLPFASCNAGAFGGRHQERYPLVAYFARPRILSLLLGCAVLADIGLTIGEGGEIVAYAVDIRHMRAFAGALISRRGDFRSIRTSRCVLPSPKKRLRS
jgi:hypothetical protein